MLNLVEKKVPIHKIEFEAGDVFIRQLTISESSEVDAIKDDEMRMLVLFQKSICDESGKPCYTVEQLKNMHSDYAKAIFYEIQEVNKAKKKADLKKEN